MKRTDPGLSFCHWKFGSILVRFYAAISRKSMVYYGRSRSWKLVPIESPYTTSCYSSIVIIWLSSIASEIWQFTGWKLRLDRQLHHNFHTDMSIVVVPHSFHTESSFLHRGKYCTHSESLLPRHCCCCYCCCTSSLLAWHLSVSAAYHFHHHHHHQKQRLNSLLSRTTWASWKQNSQHH